MNVGRKPGFLHTAKMRHVAILSFIIQLYFIACVDASERVADIPVPGGYSRTLESQESFAQYLRSLPVKPNKQIKTWDGMILKGSQYNTLAVIDLPLLFNEDLEQCADFSMRFWAEYLKSINSLDQLSLFAFYGKKRPFDASGKSFRNYLKWHMRYSNSYSIKLGAKKVESLNDLRAGDMFVQNNSEEGIGHVSVVVDEAVNNFGEKIFLIGFSYMPAQQFHIEAAVAENGVERWFTARGYFNYAKSQFGAFGTPTIMRYERDKYPQSNSKPDSANP